MGEMADWIVDNSGWINGGSFGVNETQYRASMSVKVCRCCGEKGLHWGRFAGKWRLFKGSGIHICPAVPLKIGV